MPLPAMSGAVPCTASNIAHAAVADVRRRRDAEPADEARRQIAQDVAEQVHRDDHVEPLGRDHELHRGRVDDHVLELDVGIALGDLAPAVEEQAVASS